MAGFACALVLLASAAPPPAPCDAPKEPPLAPAPSSAPRTAPRRATATPPGTHITLAWLLTQLIPSPELAVGDDGARFGLRWQVVPLAYSFGIDRRLSPFRAFVVEPLVRSSGSLELFVAPEYLAIDEKLSRRFRFRVSVRAYY